MAKTTITLSANTAGTKLGTVAKRRDFQEWRALVFAYGTFGSGTVTLNWSPDGGTTLVPLTDVNGNAVTMTSNKGTNVSLTTGSHNTDKIGLYAVLSGSTSPALTVGFYDNN